MKNFTTGLNILLVAAVAVLFYLHFASGTHKAVVKSEERQGPRAGSCKIAYFEIDSIQSKFEYFKEVRSILQAKDQANSKQLNQMRNDFAVRLQDLQKKAPAMTQAEVNNKQEELRQLEKSFQNKEQMMNNELQDESTRRLQEVQKKIKDYLVEYNKDKGYSYIFSNLSDLLYLKDTAYDITADVVRGLNIRYKKK
ncbi:MAG: hypothetical protein NVSMB63_05100 [Sediminibacterium sp.]